MMINIPYFTQEKYQHIIHLLGKGTYCSSQATPMLAGMTCCVVNTKVLDKWIVDSGDSSHMVNSLKLLINPKAFAKYKSGTVQLLTWNEDHISHIGSSYII